MPAGGKAPDFVLSDLRGGKVGLAGMRGRAVLLEFWATWCPPCRESIPEMNEMHAKFGPRGLEVVGVAVDRGSDAPAVVGSFARENRIAYLALLDDGKTAEAYGVGSIPAIFLIDKEGKIVKRVNGFVPGMLGQLSQELEVLL